MADFIFNGKYVIGTDRLNFPKDYKACSGEKEWQSPKHQLVVDKGPLPEWIYEFQIQTDIKLAEVVRTYISKTISYTCEPVRLTSGLIQNMPTILQSFLGLKLKKDSPEYDICKNRLSQFGSRRVPLVPKGTLPALPNKKPRSGFYIHDSLLGETNGCIEVESIFFDHIQKYQQKNTNKKSLTIEVKYLDKDMTTNYDEAASRGITKHLYPQK